LIADARAERGEQRLCRMDAVKDLAGTTLGIDAFNVAHCDDGSLLGSGGQTVFDPEPIPGSTGGNLHYVYVAQNDHLSPGVLRFVYDEQADGGEADIVAGSGEVMAPNAGLDGDKANGLALGHASPARPRRARTRSTWVASSTASSGASTTRRSRSRAT
jgi:hypothetical protein